jgi:hypothetical protein
MQQLKTQFEFCFVWVMISGGGWEFFSLLPRPERLWGLPNLSNGYQGLFPWW